MKTAVLRTLPNSLDLLTCSLRILIPKRYGNRFLLVAPVFRAQARLEAAGFPRTTAMWGKEAARGREKESCPQQASARGPAGGRV